MRVRYPLLVAIATVVMAASVAQAQTSFVATLDALQEVPPNASPASGFATVTLNAAQTTLSWSVTYFNLLAPRTASHFHAPAPPGVNAGVKITIAGGGPTSDVMVGSAPIAAADVVSLLGGLMYINVHSSVFPGGEIRGQVLLGPVPTRASTWGRIKQLYR